MKKYKINHFSNLHLEAAEAEAGKNSSKSYSVKLSLANYEQKYREINFLLKDHSAVVLNVDFTKYFPIYIILQIFE